VQTFAHKWPSHSSSPGSAAGSPRRAARLARQPLRAHPVSQMLSGACCRESRITSGRSPSRTSLAVADEAIETPTGALRRRAGEKILGGGSTPRHPPAPDADPRALHLTTVRMPASSVPEVRGPAERRRRSGPTPHSGAVRPQRDFLGELAHASSDNVREVFRPSSPCRDRFRRMRFQLEKCTIGPPPRGARTKGDNPDHCERTIRHAESTNRPYNHQAVLAPLAQQTKARPAVRNTMVQAESLRRRSDVEPEDRPARGVL